MWNVVAVGGGLEYGAEGQPLANSHYGYHMASQCVRARACLFVCFISVTELIMLIGTLQVMWHIPFALTGQHWDAPSASLSFAPKLSAPFSLPVFIPGSTLLLTAHANGGGTLSLVAGTAVLLKTVVVGNSTAADLPKTLALGDSVEW
jgi:hypothetical protein|eukprot:COSAG02_NODE_155_length_33066_cov_32.167562_34_plen_148_part_00